MVGTLTDPALVVLRDFAGLGIRLQSQKTPPGVDVSRHLQNRYWLGLFELLEAGAGGDPLLAASFA